MREEIARAAHELFVECGYSATILPKVAEAAGVSPPDDLRLLPEQEDIP